MVPYNDVQLVCPIRGLLKVHKNASNGFTPSEEYFRIEAIRFLLTMGYPKANFRIEPIVKRFGSGGRNSFRADFAVLDVSDDSIGTNDPDELLGHALIICEVKRDNGKFDYVNQTQVKPLLDFASNLRTLALYWDNIDKRVFWNEIHDGIKVPKEGPLAFVPKFGHKIETVPLTFETIRPTDSLIEVFDRIINILHQSSFSPERRYEIILQLLLAKIFDEHAFESLPKQPLSIQDYVALGSSAEAAETNIKDVIKRAVTFYEKYLPNKISDELPLTADTLLAILRILAPIKIIHSKREVIQTFYMKFAKDMYKWDMAQYFTPPTVTDFIVEIANPQFGEHISDPACGSADFLVAAFRAGMRRNANFVDSIWGVDNSPNAVQVAVLNMLLNGDGKTNITRADSLENIENYKEKYDIVICNPPFGTRIVEKRKNVLRQFDLGHEWVLSGEMGFKRTDKLLPQQETGILFLEACVKQCRPGGRIAIILPNGYLGNRSAKYLIVREWLLKHGKVAAIVSLPRFTFKSSGADVSASVVYLEKRKETIANLNDDYCFAVEVVERIGWDAGNKKASPIYKRNPEDGSLIADEAGDLITDCDFSDILDRISCSDAAACFGWLNRDSRAGMPQGGWSVPIANVYSDADLTLDPKRYSRKVVELRSSLANAKHLLLGDIVDFIPEKRTSQGKKIAIEPSTVYQYVEIQNIGYGDYHSNEIMGWELPGRARHFAEAGDIYFGSIWGSAVKWCIIPENSERVVLTNGCFRCRIKKQMEAYLPDLLSYFNSEGWGVQMRSFARGSDGLAEISQDDAKNVIVPLLDDICRAEMRQVVANLQNGRSTVASLTKTLRKAGRISYADPDKRPSHIALV
jgi:type I restriction enzyme M protein